MYQLRRRTAPARPTTLGPAWVVCALLAALFVCCVPSTASASTGGRIASDRSTRLDTPRDLSITLCSKDSSGRHDGCSPAHRIAPQAPRVGEDKPLGSTPVLVPAVLQPAVAPAALLPLAHAPRGPDIHQLQIMRI
jgi:hypothetical protein